MPAGKPPSQVEATAGGIAWTLEEGFAQPLTREVLPHIQALDSLPQARLVKRSLQRTVHLVELSGGSRVIVKEYRLRNWRQRLKRRLFGPKPVLEWRASRRLLEVEVPASHAIAVGLPAPPRQDVEGYLIVEVLPGVTSLPAHLRELARPGGGEAARAHGEFLRELARFVRRLHDRGVSHHDLHCGNILVHPAAAPDARFLVIDLHRISIGAPPGPWHRALAIAQLLLSFGNALALDDDARTAAFLDAYQAAGQPIQHCLLSPEEILRAIRACADRRRGSRAKRCIKESTRFTVETLNGWRIWHRRDYAAEAILALWDRHAAGQGAGSLQLREYPRRGPLARLLGRLRHSPAVRDYAAAHRAWLASGEGPQAIAAAECLRGPHKGRSFTLLAPEGSAFDRAAANC